LSQTPERSRRAIILLSDGDDTSSTIKRQDVIDLAVKSEVVVYSIGIRDRDFPLGKMDSGSLKKIAERTGGRAFFPTQPDDLKLAFSQIDQELRSQYLITYRPSNNDYNGSYRKVEVKLTNANDKYRLRTKRGYKAIADSVTPK